MGVDTKIIKLELFFLNFSMKLLLFLGAALASAREPLTWTWYDIATNSTTDYMAILPEATDYKNQTAAYKECQKYDMNLVTIGSLEEQKNWMEMEISCYSWGRNKRQALSPK